MDTIFVSVASYRDDECPETLNYLFNNADNPHNVYIGICQQNTEDDIDCIVNIKNNHKFKNNIRIIRLKHHEAKGPTWARYLCSTLYNNEKYFFQIDSHTKLVKGWDTKCINMMKSLKASGKSQNPVLSHYPTAWESFDKNEWKEIGVTTICKSFFNERDMISFLGAEFINTNEMNPSPYVAGGFLFSEGKMLKDVPFDPTLDYLFVGEEILHSIRIWTSGYDIFTPNENIAFHEYTRSEKPKIWTDKVYTDEEAFQKVKELIGLENKKDNLKDYKYNIGTKRSLEEYYSFAGIDLKNKKVTKNFCRKDLIDDDVTLSNNNEITTQSTTIEHFGNNSNNNGDHQDDMCRSTINILHIIVICIIVFILYKLYKRHNR
jgi:hypothetical protein